jgi:hypothetical protein
MVGLFQVGVSDARLGELGAERRHRIVILQSRSWMNAVSVMCQSPAQAGVRRLTTG